jgi:hypothetical protein
VQAIRFNKRQAAIKQNWKQGVQGMKSDAAATGVVYGGCQQMIEIYQHGRHHQNIGQFPVMAKKQQDDNRRNDEMQGEVYDLNFLGDVTQ